MTSARPPARAQATQRQLVALLQSTDQELDRALAVHPADTSAIGNYMQSHLGPIESLVGDLYATTG